MSRDGFQLKIKQADQKISEVLTRVADESTQNIRNEDGSFTEEYKNELEKIRLSIIKPATSKVTNQEKLNNDLIKHIRKELKAAASNYSKDVKRKKFPLKKHSY